MSGLFVSGFSIVRNAVKMAYPIEAALRSIAPLCDEVVVNVGDSEDGTLNAVRGIGDPKIRILESEWGDELERSNLIHSIETNRALDACRGLWCFYIQADEIVHEHDYEAIRRTMQRYAGDPHVEGLLFDYLHFYGSPEWVGLGRRWYRREVRIVRRASGIRSVAGAQGFRVDGRKPRAARSGARIFHYGWAKPPQAIVEKRLQAGRYGGDAAWRSRPRETWRRIPGLRRFEGTHPAAIQPWLQRNRWEFDPRAYPRDWSGRSLKALASDAVERVTGWRPFEHRNYVRVD